MATVIEDKNLLIKKRGVLRSIVTKTINEASIAKEEDNGETLKIKLFTLRSKVEELARLDEMIFNLMMVDEATEEELEEEILGAQKYQERIYKCSLLEEAESSVHSASVSIQEKSKRIRLPKLELRIFDGQLKNWLGWWAHFETIDKSELSDSEKFQYLVQAVSGPAKELVLGFPPTAENYKAALNILNDRYGNPDILGEYYTRDLLALCLKQTNGRNDIKLVHDRVETALRSLEALKIKLDDCAPILTPLVESTLPPEIIRTFRRSLNNENQSSKERLKLLLKFLKKEIETEQRVVLASSGFEPEEKVVKRSAQILHTTHLRSDSDVCIFCETRGHNAKDCQKSYRWKLEEKKAILLKIGACFACTGLNHLIKDCPLTELCKYCAKKHVATMCPAKRYWKPESLNIAGSSELRNLNAQEETEQVANETVINMNTMSEKMILPIILIPLRGRWGQVRHTRALLDSGSERSYIIIEVARKLGLQVIATETMKNCLFGGINTEEKKLLCYLITAESSNFTCELELLGIEQITIELLPEIIWRFRENEYGICADIEKAFLRIGIQEADRNFLKLLWWNSEGEIIALRHTRVVFGLKPSPFLLGAVLKLHLRSQKKTWVTEKMKSSFYMDDLVCSVNCKEEVLELRTSAQEIMKSANMNLRKWIFTGYETELLLPVYLD